jgi:translin
MQDSTKLLAEVDEALKDHPDVYYAGFVQDAQKEHAEAHQTYALIRGEPLPNPDDLKVGYAAYLNALGEAVGELRRYALDGIRHNDLGWGEGILANMDEIYYAMSSFDYPNAISRGLKRTADVTRSLIERTRGDITNAVRQQLLESALADIESRFKEHSD